MLLGELFVAVGDRLIDPRGERLAHDGVGDIDEPLPGDFVHVAVVG